MTAPVLEPASRYELGTDVYLTNEAFLYRVVEVGAGGLDELIAIEDCYRLDVVRVRGSELRARGLRVVTPAEA